LFACLSCWMKSTEMNFHQLEVIVDLIVLSSIVCPLHSLTHISYEITLQATAPISLTLTSSVVLALDWFTDLFVENWAKKSQLNFYMSLYCYCIIVAVNCILRNFSKTKGPRVQYGNQKYKTADIHTYIYTTKETYGNLNVIWIVSIFLEMPISLLWVFHSVTVNEVT